MHRINVLIVTYKQADVIGRNIESILQQKEYGLNRIVVCDDCSPDNNWEVIQSYVKKYPEYIEAYRNELNLGIYGNSNKLVSLRGDADFYCWLEGDDALCDGFFKAAQEYFKDNSIDVTKALGVFSGFQITTTQGKTIIRKNDFFKHHPKANPFRSYVHGAVSWRSGLFTKEVLNRFEPVPLDQGLGYAETRFDSQWFNHVDRVFYMPYVSTIYYSGIGVSQLLTAASSYQKEEALAQWYYYSSLDKWNFIDRCWILSNINRAKYNINRSPLYLFKYLILFPIGSMGYPLNAKSFVISLWNMVRCVLPNKK